MIRDIYHIKVKAEHASNVLEDLLEKGEIEIIEEDDTPEWQKREVLRRLAELKVNPALAMSEEEFFAALDEDDDDI